MQKILMAVKYKDAEKKTFCLFWDFFPPFLKITLEYFTSFSGLSQENHKLLNVSTVALTFIEIT